MLAANEYRKPESRINEDLRGMSLIGSPKCNRTENLVQILRLFDIKTCCTTIRLQVLFTGNDESLPSSYHQWRARLDWNCTIIKSMSIMMTCHKLRESRLHCSGVARAYETRTTIQTMAWKETTRIQQLKWTKQQGYGWTTCTKWRA